MRKMLLICRWCYLLIISFPACGCSWLLLAYIYWWATPSAFGASLLTPTWREVLDKLMRCHALETPEQRPEKFSLFQHVYSYILHLTQFISDKNITTEGNGRTKQAVRLHALVWSKWSGFCLNGVRLYLHSCESIFYYIYIYSWQKVGHLLWNGSNYCWGKKQL